jgi:2-C-methyl-D-erythritol 4-phosphate cytidylyltransferase/2-C-methyl-D-erythritol 2,4-cyclodiphosphate synthase
VKNVVLIVAGGSGSRIGGVVPKQYLNISGKSILRTTVETFLANPQIDSVKVVINKAHEEHYKTAVQGLNLLPHSLGGDNRQRSVYNGLSDLVNVNPSNVLIHDAARPFVSTQIIDNVIEKLKEYEAVDLGITPKDTIKQIVPSNCTLDRDSLYCTQTPQGFRFKTILNLHEEYKDLEHTDDISLALKANIPVGFVYGEASNIKITTTEDLKMYNTARIGMGFDVHKFDTTEMGNNNIPICGIKIPFDYKVIAHSDGDVGLHALMDSILGAAALDDIGVHFPPSDDKWKDADSCKLLKHANTLLKAKGGIIQNIDITIIAERPRIMGFKDEMKKKISEVLQISQDIINIKATTTEKLGFIGRGEGIAAQAVCSISI